MKNIKNKEIEPYNNISRHACYFFQMLTKKLCPPTYLGMSEGQEIPSGWGQRHSHSSGGGGRHIQVGGLLMWSAS